MTPEHDPRTRIALRVARMAWIFLSAFLGVIMGASYLLGSEQMLWGLPIWITVGNIIVPVFFVGLLIFVVERFIPDVQLDDAVRSGEDA